MRTLTHAHARTAPRRSTAHLPAGAAQQHPPAVARGAGGLPRDCAPARLRHKDAPAGRQRLPIWLRLPPRALHAAGRPLGGPLLGRALLPGAHDHRRRRRALVRGGPVCDERSAHARRRVALLRRAGLRVGCRDALDGRAAPAARVRGRRRRATRRHARQPRRAAPAPAAARARAHPLKRFSCRVLRLRTVPCEHAARSVELSGRACVRSSSGECISCVGCSHSRAHGTPRE
eukprot:739671-Prymnesium_polylepis.1